MIVRISAVLMLACTLITAAFAQEQDLTEIRRKAAAGDAKSQYELAAAYYSGSGIAKDPAQGLEWLRKSATQGYVGAEFALAYMYERGEQSVSKNPHEAANWFRKAAAQNNDAAKSHLKQMLSQGLISEEEANWASPSRDKASRNSAASKKAESVAQAANANIFSLAEVEKGLAGGITNKRMADLVAKFGVNFPVNSSTRKRLVDDGADDNLIAAISSARR